MRVFGAIFSAVAFLPCIADAQTSEKRPSFGLINGYSGFFDPVQEAWATRCELLNVTCHIHRLPAIGCEDVVEVVLKTIWDDLLYNQSVDGIGFPPNCDHPSIEALVQQAQDAGVPVVTFDFDLPNSTRAAYVGTDNEFLGRTMARLLRQLRPEGGTFSVIAPKDDRITGFMDEIMKNNDDEDKAHWYQIGETDDTYWSQTYMDQMNMLARQNPTAMLFFRQTPMRNENWTDFVDAHRHRNITLIGTDGSDYQLAYLNRRYVDGLIGQLPYEWGTAVLDTLTKLSRGETLRSRTIPTNVVAHNLIPIELPELEVDQNLLEKLVYFGYTCLGLIILTALACVGWTYYYRNTVVVKVAQPFFLFMIAGGVLLMSMTLIPLSLDDNGEPEHMSQAKSIGICMSIPWLATIGFAVTFAALFSKTWRVNRLFRGKMKNTRVHVDEKDVLAPFTILLISNIIVLTCWTVIDPLTYVRTENDGTDYWNRVLSEHGSCRSDNVAPYLVLLGVLNFSLVAIACYQAFQARNIESEFSEAKWIGLSVFSLCQAFLTGLPILVLVKDTPEAFYLVLTLMIFVLSMVILSLIFLPKVLIQRQYAGLTEEEQKREIKKSIQLSSQQHDAGSKRLSGADNRYDSSVSSFESSQIGKSGFGASGSCAAQNSFTVVPSSVATGGTTLVDRTTSTTSRQSSVRAVSLIVSSTVPESIAEGEHEDQQ